MGYQPVAEPRPRGPLWVTHAVDRDGLQVRVLIDSFSGRVIDVLRRPVPPQRVAVVPPPNFPPQANTPMSDYDDEGPDYDYRNAPQRRPADWPPSRPNVQQQGPSVIPHDQRGDNRSLNPPKSNTAKKKEAKDKKKEAALTPEKEKEKTPSPMQRPADAPKPDAKSSQTPTFVPTEQQKKDLQVTGSVTPPAQGLEMKKSAPPASLPPVQPPF